MRQDFTEEVKIEELLSLNYCFSDEELDELKNINHTKVFQLVKIMLYSSAMNAKRVKYDQDQQ